MNRARLEAAVAKLPTVYRLEILAAVAEPEPEPIAATYVPIGNATFRLDTGEFGGVFSVALEAEFDWDRFGELLEIAKDAIRAELERTPVEGIHADTLAAWLGERVAYALIAQQERVA